MVPFHSKKLSVSDCLKYILSAGEIIVKTGESAYNEMIEVISLTTGRMPAETYLQIDGGKDNV